MADPKSASTRLGEELPIFCEKCGYSLHGLTQVRCEHCEILHFHCPECGHHQPINTLRPAAQRIIGRVRMVWLSAVVLFKLNFFGWLLFGWVGMGASWCYEYVGGATTWAPRHTNFEEFIAFTLFAVPFGMCARMLLLRWHSGALVGVVIALLVSLAIIAGARFEQYDISSYSIGAPWTPEFQILIAWTAGVILVSAILALPFWNMLVRIFLPPKVGQLMIEWQRSASDRPIASLARN